MTLTPTVSSPATAPASRTPRVGVPWTTVLPLAVLLTAADGFWMSSLHNAVGDISRTQEPFTSYWRTSVLMAPMFVFAVLAALTWGLGRFGPQLRSRRAVLTTGLLVVAAATLTAVVLSGASAAYDYHLQSGQLGMMQSMQHDCDTACLGRQRWLTAGAHARAIGYTSAALLATNLVVVGWFVAFRGGRLAVVGSHHRPVGATPRSRGTGSRARDLRSFLLVGLLVNAVVHAAVVPEHSRVWSAAGVFFVLLALAEVVVASRLSGSRPRLPLVGAVLVSVVPLAVWLVSRTVGLPFGPEPGAAEAVGLADTLAGVLETGTLVVAVTLLRWCVQPARAPVTAHQRGLVLVGIVAVGALALTGVSPAWLDGAAGADAVEMVHQPR